VISALYEPVLRCTYEFSLRGVFSPGEALRNMAKHFVLNTIMLFLSLSLALALSEVLLRVRGFRPWRYASKDANEPTMHEPDPVLGWRNKRGNYIVPPYHPSGQPIQFTFLENGRRSTGVNSSVNSEGELVLIGDSFTQGWAINDSETYAWKLQEKFPFFQVLNYGTSAYGSYQSLLTLERELPCLAHPKFVLYGFLKHHEMRNVAPVPWIGRLSKKSRRGYVAVPFVTLDAQKRLVRHAPERYLALPFRESSALITFFAKAYMDLKMRGRLSQMRSSTEHILLQMNRVSEEYNTTFIVVLLTADNQTKEHYMKFLRENNIQVVDCVYAITDEMKVLGEGHPNGKMNTLWAECISGTLKDQFEKSRSFNKSVQSTPGSSRCIPASGSG
jgi:hypothetical protein